MKKPTDTALVFLLFFTLVPGSLSPDVENLKIGCFVESPTNREFRISPGDYQPWSLTPYDCVKLCGKMKYSFAALQNGNLCFCAKNFSGIHGASVNCTNNCTGDENYQCGGVWANSVYNASLYEKNFIIDYSGSPLVVFETVNLTASYVNESNSELRAHFNIGDGTGEGPDVNAQFNFRVNVWGKITVAARPSSNVSLRLESVQRDLYIHASPERAELKCPAFVGTDQVFKCIAKVYEGTFLEASWQFQDGIRQNISLPDPLYTRVGSAIPQWVVPGVTSDFNVGVFLIPSFHFSSEARLLALEMYGHTAGDVKVVIIRPLCNSSMPNFCVSNLSCTYQQCPAYPSYPCILPDILCASQTCCHSPLSGNCSKTRMSSTLIASELTISADLGVFRIKTGYNLFVLPKNQTFDVLPGDMVGWGPASDGRIAQNPGQGTVHHFPGLDATTLQTGSNISTSQSVALSNMTYMINMIGSQASPFVLNHWYNTSGVYWAQVNFTSSVGSVLTLDPQPITVQPPLSSIFAVYPKHFSFYGVQPNNPVELSVNISTDSRVSVTWRLVNSSSLLQSRTVDSAGNQYALDTLNYTFANIGMYALFVEASDNVSSVNTTVIVHVQGPLTNLSAQVISGPVYLGAIAKLQASASGANIKYQWTFGDGPKRSFSSNSTVSYRFPQTGPFNVTVIASNLASSLETWFVVNVVQSLSVTVPSQSTVDSPVNSSCSLIGPFDQNQYYYWDHGDGSREEGLGKTQVSHNYTKGGKYLVSVKLRNEVLVNVSSEISVLEPVSGLVINNVSGVELFDRKTFTARTTTGNNLTYEWYFRSNSTISILICLNSSIEFHFNTSGWYSISVNVSNSVSFEYANISFPVQERITGLKITAAPNPAPSNSTITFNVTKGSGTFGTYRLDFGDGFVVRNFADNLLFNRTFTSGQWQIILTGENAVSHVIVFYNVTVEDPVVNISVGVDAEREFFGRKMVAVGTSTPFHSNTSEGTSVVFHWNFGDNNNRYGYKGSQQPSGVTTHVIDHVFSREGQFNVSVNASNSISQLGAWTVVHAQQKIEGFDLIMTDRASPGDLLTFRFSQTKGGNVSYIVDFGDNGSYPVITTTSLAQIYNNVGAFNVTAKAVNQISSQEIVKTVTVQYKIQGFDLLFPIAPVETGLPTVIAWKITGGSEVKFRVDFGDSASPIILDSEVEGMSVKTTLNHTYSSWGDYQVQITAYSLVGPNKTISRTAAVDDPIIGLVAYTNLTTIKMFENVTITASVSNGSRVKYHFDFDDGSDPVNTTRNSVSHQYTRDGQFNALVTAHNAVNTVTSRVNATITVEKPDQPLEIRGLNVSCQPTVPGNASKIVVSYEYGFLFQCELSFGDGTKATFNDSALRFPIWHRYHGTGAFDVLLRCGNVLGSQTIQTKAHVDEVIEGLKFENGQGRIEVEFGRSVKIEWAWSAGSNINVSVILSGVGSIPSKKTGLSGYVELDSTLCTTPGEYTVSIKLSNSITPEQELKARVTFVERISNVTISLNPITRTDFPLCVYVDVATGSNLNVHWKYGDGSDNRRVEKGHGFRRFDESHVYSSQGTFLVEVSVSNEISQEVAFENVTVINPVRGFTFHQNNSAIWPSRNIDFKFSRDSADHLNAKYVIEFGDEEKSAEVSIDPIQTHFTHSHFYSKPGCRSAKLIIWNFISRVELVAPVQIVEPISGAVLRPLQSHFSAHPGYSGGGPRGNTFPLDYPVSFTISQDTGTCLSYDWAYGDYHNLTKIPNAVTEHAYPLPGRYVVVGEVYNSLGRQTLQSRVKLENSVMGLYLATSGPGKPGESVTFVVFCARRGTNSKFVFNSGSGNNVTFRRDDFRKYSNLKTKPLIDPNINLPFKPADYFAKKYSDVYNKPGLFVAQVWAWNDASHQSARASVFVMDKTCSTPLVRVIGGHADLDTSSMLVHGVRFSLTSQVQINCEENNKATFEWVVYGADTYSRSSSSSSPLLPPESGREVSLPPEIVTDQSSITILESTLAPGSYIFQLTVTLHEVGISNTDQAYIRIAGADIQARIAGGDLRTHAWEESLVLDASESRDEPRDWSGLEDLSYAWYCSITKGNAAILHSGLGCFGNGEGKVEYTQNIFVVEPRRLFESTTYVFTVNVSSPGTGRWSQTNQTVTVVPGKPPNIKISCESNCEKYLYPSKRLVLTTSCTNCDDIKTLIYSWSAEEATGSVPFEVWPEHARTPQNFPDAVILGDTFGSGTAYRIRVTARHAGSESTGLAEHHIITSFPPRGGNCNITPETGVELETKFAFTCGGWQDEDQPLSYEISYPYPSQSTESGTSPFYAFFGPLLSNTEVVLPVGEKDKGYALNVTITIRDARGVSVDNKSQIQVKPVNFTSSDLSNKTVGPGNDLENMIGRGEIQAASQLITVISDILNDQANSSDVSDSIKTTKQQIRSAMIKFLAGFRPQTLDDVLLGSRALQVATDTPDEITVESQLLASKKYSSMAAMLTKETLRGEDAGLVESISRVILLGLSNVFVASTSSIAEIRESGDGSNVQSAQESVSVALDAMDEVFSALLITLRTGESPLVISTGSLVVGLSKRSPENLAGTAVDLGGEGKFNLPSDGELVNKTKGQSYITSTMTTLSINPFTSSNTSSLIKSKPLSLVLKGDDGKVIPIEGLTSPIEILLPQTQEEAQDQLSISETPLPSGGMSVHRISVPNNNSVLQAEVTPSDGLTELTVFLRYHEPPTSTEYDLKTSLPNGSFTSGPYRLFISRDQMKGTGDYYIGVLPDREQGQAVNYTFEVTCSACYFWSEQTSEWTSEGCRVHEQSTRQLTRCQCSHLTWFGADLFIPPNKLDIMSSIKKLADLHKYPALLATFCVIIGLYIVGLIWARRRDRQDICKVGLVPVLDNDPNERYRYEVTVYTGRGKHTGTTANVSLMIGGEEMQSTTHVLRSTSRSCLQSGGVDSFLITTSDCLGSLEYIRIWHDNSGKSPSWFLSQIVIRDIETDEKFFFLVNNWLACDEGDGQVDRLIPVAGKDELRDFVHLFKAKTSRDFSDGHLWFSIAFRPVRSRFTCVQRVSCCLSLLMCSMLANVMWYNTPVKKHNDVLIDLGFFEFTWHEILIGIQSSLIVFPINLLIVQLFRKIAVSPKAKKRFVERTRKESQVPNNNQRKQTAVSLSDITPSASRARSAVSNQKHVTLRNLTSIRGPAAARKDSWDDDFFCTLLESQIGALSESKDTTPRRRKPIMEEHEDELPDILSSDIYYLLYKEEARHHEEVSPESVCSGDSGDTTTALVNIEKPKKKKKKKRKLECLFPWWFVYIGWFLCVSTAIVAGFFTLLYGLNFDNKQQEEWLVSMFVSIGQDILVSQPLKVIFIAILFALLLKKPQDEEDDVINAELARDEEWLEQTFTQAQKGDMKDTDLKSHRPPDQVLLRAARIRLFKERTMHSVIREIVFYFLFVWVVLLIAYGHRDPNAHFMTQNIENTFVGRQESLVPREDEKAAQTGNDDILKLFDVNNVNDFWEWANQTLAPGLYNGAWYNGQLGQPGFLDDKMSFVVGVARIRQLRVKNGSCEGAKVFSTLVDICNEPYSWDAEDQTPQYAPGWKAANESHATSSKYSAWRYRETAELKTRAFLGHIALYRGGGYKADLGPSIESAYAMIKDLKSNVWIDKYTRAVFIEFTVYNGHSNLYCVANLLLEFTAAGGSVPFVQLLTTRIDRYVGNFLLFVLICEVSFVFFTIVFTVREFKRLIKSNLKTYLSEFWTWIELGMICLSWTSIVLYFVRFGIDRLTKKAFRENPKQFVDFYYLAIVDQIFGYVYAFVVFLMSSKFIRLFRFNRRMSLLGSTIKCSAKELCHFGIIFSLVFVAFSHLCYLLFSHELYKFHTFVTTAETLLSVMLGKFSYVSLEKTNRVLGPIMFFFYSVGVVFILINMFLSIIIENFRRVKQNNDLQSNEHEIVDFMTEQFMNWLGVKSRTMFRNRVGDEEAFVPPKYKKKKKINQTEQLKERVDQLVTLIKKVHFEGRDDEDFLRNDGEVTYLVPEIQLESYA